MAHLLRGPLSFVFFWSFFQPVDVCQGVGLGIAEAVERLMYIDMVENYYLFHTMFINVLP